MFNGSVEHAVAHIEESIQGKVDGRCLRWYAIKVFERDGKVLEGLDLSGDLRAHLEQRIADCEAELDDDAESIMVSDGEFSLLAAYSFMIFNLMCAPCFAAMGAIRREMNSAKWTWAAIGYICGFAYVISLIVYQIGGLISGTASFNVFTVAAAVLLAGLLYLLLRPAAGRSDTAAVRGAAVERV